MSKKTCLECECDACVDLAKAKTQQEDAYIYAKKLLTTLFPRAVPSPNLDALISQIDHWCAGTQVELATARKTNSKLHRRCQLAESAVKDNLDACKRAGQSFGRRLSAAGYLMIDAELATAMQTIAELQERL